MRELLNCLQRFTIEKASASLQVRAFSIYVLHVLKLPLYKITSERSASMNQRLTEFVNGISKLVKTEFFGTSE